MGIFGKPDPKPPQVPVSSPATAAAPVPSPPQKAAARTTVMGEKTRYVGKVDTDEPLLIHGTIEGEIKSSSEVEVGDGGVVKATIQARSIVISGRVIGDCAASDRVEIRATGKLNGSIHAAKIIIAEGAEFKGTSQMGTPPRA